MELLTNVEFGSSRLARRCLYKWNLHGTCPFLVLSLQRGAMAMKTFAQWIMAKSGAIVLIGAIFFVVASYYTFRLYGNLRTNLEELLPTGARSVMDLREIDRRFNASANLAVLVFSSHPEQSKRFMIDLAERIEKARSPRVARVEYRVDQEIRFFKKRLSLFVDESDLRLIRDYLNARIEYERDLYNPLNIFSGVTLVEPRLDIGGLEKKYSLKVADFLRFPDGFYANREQSVRVLLVFMAGDSTSSSRAQALRSDIDGIIAGMNPATYAPDIRIQYTGDVENLVEENASLVKDLKFSGIAVFILCALAIFIFYGNFMATLALILSLLIGASLTFGVSYFTVGYLNANSAFLGSIVFGNGINFGIIVLARYMEERRGGNGHADAIVTALDRSKTATLTAALAAGLSYASLMLTDFRGFRQFGWIGFLGMLFCWLSAYTFLPAILTRIERRNPKHLTHSFIVKGSGRRFSDYVAAFVQRFHRSIASISVILAIVSVFLVLNFRGRIIQADTTQLRDKTSMESGSGYYSQYLDRIFGRYISPMAVLPKTQSDSDQIFAKLKSAMRSSDLSQMVSAVYSPHDLVPSKQIEKIGILKEIRKLLKPRILSALSRADRPRAEELLQKDSYRPFTMKDLPEAVKLRFRERDGSLGKVILVNPVLDPAFNYNGDRQSELIARLRRIVDSVRPGTPIEGQLPITVDMYRSVSEDGPKATLFAFLGVVVLVMVLFRHLRAATLALLALILGAIWFAGIIAAANLQINFLNFVALPITFGVGVDYGVNIFQRYRLDPQAGITEVIRNTGGAVILASFTSMIGYGSLLMAGNRGFMSFGRLAILGEILCLVAAVIALPSFLGRPTASVHVLRTGQTESEHKRAA